MFWSANLLHETGHQCRATLVHLSVSCYDPSMWSLSVSSDTSASPREQIKPGVFCSAVCWNPAFEEDDLFWSDSSFAPRFSLWHPFLSSLRFYWSTQKSQWKQQMETRRLLPRSHQSAAWHYPTLSSSYFFFFFPSCSSLKSSSAPLSANVKNPTRRWGNSVVALCCFYWLAPCSLCDVSQHSQSSSSTPRFNPSIDWCNNEKMFLKIHSGWLDTIFYCRWRGHSMFQCGHWA